MPVPLFCLDTHQPHWLWHAEFQLFAATADSRGRALPPAACRRALDSAGTPNYRCSGDGRPWLRTTLPPLLTTLDRSAAWTSPQDRMRELRIIERTGLSVREQQETHRGELDSLITGAGLASRERDVAQPGAGRLGGRLRRDRLRRRRPLPGQNSSNPLAHSSVPGFTVCSQGSTFVCLWRGLGLKAVFG